MKNLGPVGLLLAALCLAAAPSVVERVLPEHLRQVVVVQDHFDCAIVRDRMSEGQLYKTDRNRLAALESTEASKYLDQHANWLAWDQSLTPDNLTDTPERIALYNAAKADANGVYPWARLSRGGRVLFSGPLPAEADWLALLKKHGG